MSLHRHDMLTIRVTNKHMKKNRPRLSKTKVIIFGLSSLLLVAGTTLSWLSSAGKNGLAAAAQCTSIADCQQQINNNNNAVAQLQNQATSYQDAISHLQAAINQMQGQIDNNMAQQADLQGQIDKAQAELEQQKRVLGDDIKAMYVDGQPTTIEMLASSNNLSDFVDKEEYRTAVQSKIQDTLTKVSELQNQLKDQKSKLDGLLQQYKTQQSQLAADRSQQDQMLAYNQSQQASYNTQTAANQQKLQQLIAAQRNANLDTSASYYFIRFPGAVAPHNPGTNDYPYAGSGFGMSTAPGCVDNDGPDQWGYCTRQCVSYAAWAVQRSGRTAPRYYGNARDWVAAARRDGIHIYTSDPQPGDVAISTAGTWGHAMYVEAVNGSQIFVSQYNQALTGEYSTQWRTWE